METANPGTLKQDKILCHREYSHTDFDDSINIAPATTSVAPRVESGRNAFNDDNRQSDTSNYEVKWTPLTSLAHVFQRFWNMFSVSGNQKLDARLDERQTREATTSIVEGETLTRSREQAIDEEQERIKRYRYSGL